MIILEVLSTKPNEEKKQDMKRFFDASGKIKIDKESINQLREASKL